MASGLFVEVFTNAYAYGHAVLRPRGYWMAATLSCGPDSLLSGHSATALWDLAKTSRSLIDVVRPRGSAHRRRGIHLHEARALTPADATTIDGIPVTSIPRTLLDLADVLSPQRLEQIIEAAERRHLLDTNAITELLNRSNGRHNIGALRAALSLPSGAIDTRSPLERRFLQFCDEHGIPRPQTNVTVAGCEVDAHWPKAKLIVELDSVTFHLTSAAFERDRERDIALSLTGETVIRVTDRRLKADPAQLAADVHALLAAGRAQRTAPRLAP